YLSFPRLLLLTSFSLSCYDDLRALHSFPTRRSSDLPSKGLAAMASRYWAMAWSRRPACASWCALSCGSLIVISDPQLRAHQLARSEEHTSELQSRENLVCRLLLEKKKKTRNNSELNT